MAARGKVGESIVETEQKQRRGLDTVEYKEVQAKIEPLKRSINATKGATDALNSKFKGASWQDVNITCDADELMRKALNKIENDARNYKVFYYMLKDITGLDVDLPSLTAELEEGGQQEGDIVTSNNSQTEPDSGYPDDTGSPSCEKQFDHKLKEIPTSPGDSNTEPEEERLATFAVGPNEEEAGALPTMSNTGKDANLIFLATTRITERIYKLQRQLKDETDAKEVLQREKDELTCQLSMLQNDISEKESAMEKELEEKQKELEELKETLSRAEQEKEAMESKYKIEVATLNKEIEKLKQDLCNEKEKSKFKILELERDLSRAEKQIAQKENIILKQQCEKSELEKKITIIEKDEEIEKLKEDNKKLRKGQSLHKSLSELDI